MRNLGRETRKSYQDKERTGFWDRYLALPGLDIGFRGDNQDAVPIAEGFTGVELGMDGYDGYHLPFPDQSQQTVYSSHTLEHIPGDIGIISEWFRVLRLSGHLILVVPHAYLYERRLNVPPSDWSPEHLRAYTPAGLLDLIESALPPNSYRIRYMADNDARYQYDVPRHVHPEGCFDIDLVVQRILPPQWKVLREEQYHD